jgi:hypothetical protein
MVDDSKKDGAKINSQLRIKLPTRWIVRRTCSSPSSLIKEKPMEGPLTMEEFARRAYPPDEIVRRTIEIQKETNHFLDQFGPWPEPTLRQKHLNYILRPFNEIRRRLYNAWLALKGHDIEDDEDVW